MKTKSNGIVHNAKGDLITPVLLNGNSDVLSDNAEVRISFNNDGTITQLADNGAGLVSETPASAYWVDVTSSPTPQDFPSTWVGPSNYEISWSAPVLSGDTSSMSVTPPVSSTSVSLSTSRSFELVVDEPQIGSVAGLVEWTVTITNLQTTAQAIWTVQLSGDSESSNQ